MIISLWVLDALGSEVAYALTKGLPSLWNALDITWSLNIATLPVALLFKHGPWILPIGKVTLSLSAICVLSLAGNALLNLSFEYIELSTASALIPSAIIWGVFLDLGEHQHPAVQGIAGCVLYLLAIVHLVMNRPPVKPSPVQNAPSAPATDTCLSATPLAEGS
jgi:drug/metabolite transporter (DMT)-like permease